MKRLIPLALLSTLFLAGCVYTDIIPREDGSRVVEINTTGWYLFDLIPIVTGDASIEGGGTTWFEDTCDADSNMVELSRILKREQAKLNPGEKLTIGPIVSHEVDEGVFVFLINRHEFRTVVNIK